MRNGADCCIAHRVLTGGCMHISGVMKALTGMVHRCFFIVRFGAALHHRKALIISAIECVVSTHFYNRVSLTRFLSPWFYQ
jgi:hypothetical protein